MSPEHTHRGTTHPSAPGHDLANSIHLLLLLVGKGGSVGPVAEQQLLASQELRDGGLDNRQGEERRGQKDIEGEERRGRQAYRVRGGGGDDIQGWVCGMRKQV